MRLLLFIILFFPVTLYSQVLTTSADETEADNPHPSAMLELRAPNKGVGLDFVALKSDTDITTIANPREGTVALNGSVYNAITHPNIPSNKPTIVVWDGSKWLFGFKEDDSIISLDFIRSYSVDNGATIVKFDDATNSSVFPTIDPAAVYNETFAAPWVTLIDNAASVNKPSFRLTNAEATQRMVIDAEGIAAINNSSTPELGFNYAYEVGIFVNDKLVVAQKFLASSMAGACHFHKYNILGVVDDQSFFNGIAANTSFIVKLAVRPLSRGSTTFYDRMVFGDDVGLRMGYTENKEANRCANLNAHTARSYMNILSIEKKK